MELTELTKKDIEIIELIGEGCTNEQIGDKMNYSLEGIKKKIVRLRKKFNAKNRTELFKNYLKSRTLFDS